MARRPVLLYDGNWRFCRWVARVVAGLDRKERLAFLSMREEEAARFLEPLPEEERFATWHLVQREGRLVSGAPGVPVLLSYLAPRLGRLPLGTLLARLYPLVARLRGRLGRVVQDGPGPRRFP